MSDNNTTSNNPTLRLCKVNNEIACVAGALQVFAAFAEGTQEELLTSCCDLLFDAQGVLQRLISDQTSETFIPLDGTATEFLRKAINHG